MPTRMEGESEKSNEKMTMVQGCDSFSDEANSLGLEPRFRS